MWLPMQSAPKDGEPILVTIAFNGEPFVDTIFWDNCYGETDYCWCIGHDEHGMVPVVNEYTAKYTELWGWMPIPEPAERLIEVYLQSNE